MHQFFFHIHRNINPDTALAFDIAKLDLVHLPELPNDWLEQLAGFDKDDAENFLKNLEGKVGEESTYSNKPELVKTLQIIYHRGTGNLNAQVGPVTQGEISATVIKLKEGVGNCAPGFHDRVNAIINGYHHPKTFSQLLTKIRETLVQRTATQLTDEVHANNRVFYVASTLGLGVAVPHKQDVYRGAISGKSIRDALQQTFKTYFTPLNLPFLIKDELESVFTYFGYQGPMDENSEGYVMGVYEEIRAYIGNVFQNLFSEKSPDLEALFKVTDNSALIAINWHYLCHVIFDALLSPKQKVIKGIDNILEFPVNTLTDCAMLSVLLFDNQVVGKEPELLRELNYSILEEIQQISKRFPDYGHCLKNHIKENKIFEGQINILLEKLIHTMSVKVTEKEFQQLMCLLDVVSTEEYKDIIANLISEKFSEEGFTFLHLICAYYKREQHTLLAYLLANFEIEVVKQMLLETDNREANALMMAARYQPEAFIKLLDFIAVHWDKLGVKCIQQMLLQTPKEGGWNALMLAVDKKTEVCSKILNFIARRWNDLGIRWVNYMLSKLFSQKVWIESNIHDVINFISEISVYENARVVIFKIFNYLKKYISEEIKQTIKADMQPLDFLLSCEDEKLVAKHATEALVVLGQDKFCDKFLEMINLNYQDKQEDCFTLLRRAADNQSFLGGCFANHSTNSIVRFFSSKTTQSQDKIKLALKEYDQQNSRPLKMEMEVKRWQR